MTEADFRKIESTLNVSLPEFYRTTMLSYPFPVDSFAEEFLLPNDPEPVLEYNQHPCEYEETGAPFVIGSDGGEEIYFIDLAVDSSQVFTYEMETGKHVEKATDWTEYLGQIESNLKEIDDERAEQERKANKKWWEFWK
jgi:hypothetical protein